MKEEKQKLRSVLEYQCRIVQRTAQTKSRAQKYLAICLSCFDHKVTHYVQQYESHPISTAICLHYFLDDSRIKVIERF